MSALALVVGCGDRGGGTSVSEDKGEAGLEGRTQRAVSVSGKWVSFFRKKGYTMTSDGYPDRSKEGKGTLTAEGMAGVFEEFVGVSLPEWVEPVVGIYRVKKYHSWSRDNFNSSVYSYFQVDPKDAKRLEATVVDEWLRRFPGDGFTHLQTVLKQETSLQREFVFPAGSMNAFVGENNDEGEAKTHHYRLIIDPKSGLVALKNVRGYES